MKCRIHRGCHEIGGNCVEMEAEGKRIVFDVGLPLESDTEVQPPNISGFASPDENLLGVFISHPHPDHYGLLERISENVPVYMGEAARRIIEVSSFFTPLPSLGKFDPLPYKDRQPIHLGPFTITPFLIDHSAFDSYCFFGQSWWQACVLQRGLAGARQTSVKTQTSDLTGRVFKVG